LRRRTWGPGLPDIGRGGFDNGKQEYNRENPMVKYIGLKGEVDVLFQIATKNSTL